MLTTVVNTMSQWNDAQWVLFGLAWLFVIGVFVFAHFVIAGVPGQVRSLYRDDEEDGHGAERSCEQSEDGDSPFDDSFLPTHAEYNHQITLVSKRASVIAVAHPLFCDEQEVRRQRAIAKLQHERDDKPRVSGYLLLAPRSLEEVRGLRLAKVNR